MKDEIYAYLTKPQTLKKQETQTEGRFVKLENFSNGKSNYIEDLFKNAKGFNVNERIAANQFLA